MSQDKQEQSTGKIHVRNFYLSYHVQVGIGYSCMSMPRGILHDICMARPQGATGDDRRQGETTPFQLVTVVLSELVPTRLTVGLPNGKPG